MKNRSTNPTLGSAFKGMKRTANFLFTFFLILFSIDGFSQIRVANPSDAGISLVGNSTYTVRWAKGGTTFSRVRIKLSVDGGVTFPYLLVNNTPNTATDTSENITVPGVITNQARIRITNQADSTVGDVSDNNFEITGYCWPWGVSCTNNFIQNFTVNTLNNSSTCSTRGYVSYTPTGTRTTNLYTGSKVPFTLKTSKTNIDMGVAIWCDFNGDKDFSDAGEFLYASSSLDTTHRDSISIPSDVTAGLKVLRVRTVRATLLSSSDYCEFYNTGGEIEDYQITVVSLPGSGPIVVRTPNATGITLDNNTSYAVRWSKGGTLYDKVKIKFSEDGGATFPYTLISNSNNLVSDTAENITVPGIITTTARIRIENQNDSTDGDISDNNFTVRGYCWPWNTICTGNFIQNFSVNSLNSTSTCSARGYVNYNTSRTTTLYSGESYTFSLKTSKTNTDMGVGIWCDFNGDFDFDDAGEFLYGSPTLDTAFSGTFSIPSGLTFANRRLRIRTVRGNLLGASNYCTFYNTGGEIEDYTVSIDQIIGAGPLVVRNPSAAGLTLTSNGSYTARWSKEGTTYDKVKIKFSEDGGITFPYLLVNNTPNTSTDTSEAFTVPGIITTQGRIQITNQSDSTIGDISDNDFTIAGYCWPWNTSCSNNFIRSVAVNTLNSTSTCSTRGYVNNAATGTRTTTLYQGLSYPITIKTSKTNNMGVAVWCDFNSDFDFDDAGEFLFTGSSLDTTFNGTISIPADAPLGTRRFRVRTVNNQLLTSTDYCAFYNSGSEIEDYTVTIDEVTGIGPLKITTPNTAGLSLATNSTYAVRWTKGNSTYDRVRIKFSADGGATFPYLLVNNTPNLSSDTAENIIVPGIITTQGRIRVSNQNDSTVSDMSDNNFTITGYCWPWSMSCSNSFLRKITLNTLSTTNTCATRAYSSAAASGANTTTLYTGQSYPFTVKTSKTSLTQGVAIWCDYNNDLDFDDAGELLYTSSSLDTSFTGSITIPEDISVGTKRLRIRTVNNQLLDSTQSCTFFNTGGEIEDFTITIDVIPGVGPLVVRTPTAAGISLATNANYTVRWAKGATTFPTAKVKLSVDGGLTYPYTLAENVSNASIENSTSILVPGIITTQAKIRVSDQNDSTNNDISDNNFAITGYCWPWGMSCTNNSINAFTLNTLSRNSGCATTRGYTVIAATGINTTTMQRGLTYPFTINTSTASSSMAVGIWCDFNNDLDFDDSGEFLYGSPSFGTSFSGNITIPGNTATGQRRLRVRTVRGTLLTASNACTFFNTGGEIEDYTITIDQPTIVITSPLTEICPGTNISVAFTTTGTFLSGNYFQVQLSNSSGVFGAGTSALANGAASPITCHVGIGTAAGTYRLRVVAATPAPALFGTNSDYFNIRSKPSTPTSTNGSRCGTGTVTLSAAGCSTIEWYNASTKGTLVGTGASFVTPSISSTTNYFATCIDAQGCQSLRKQTSATVNPVPTITSFNPTSGSVGFTNVVISGTAFSVVDSVVFSGNAKAQIISKTSTSITVRTPVNAASGTIRVYTPCGMTTSSGSFTAVVPNIATPVISLTSGTYPSSTTTTLSCATAGADIYYTLNGVTPDPNNPVTLLYTGDPIFIGVGLTLKAIGYKQGWTTSGIATATYTITTPTIVATPVILPASGTYTGGQVLTITCSTPQSSIYFTLNGQEPIMDGNTPIRYLGPITVAENVSVKAIGVRDGWSSSPAAWSELFISGASTLSACTFDPAPGAYSGAQSVTINNADPSAQIYYTTDGTDPYRYLPLAKPYAGPVAINSSLTLKASAYRDGFGDSPRTVGDYTIGAVRMAVDNSKPAYYTEPSGPVYSTGNNPSPLFPASNNDMMVSLYPNPTNGILFIDFGARKENMKITILNVMGQVVNVVETEGASFGAALNLSENKPGVYIVRISDSNGNQVEKKVVLQ
jgi:hypothetical protein